MSEKSYIEIIGARENNLRNVDVRIPHNSLTVITGLSGSGKSSLAFDTLYAEGQRRYLETFPAYARNFLGGGERPDVDKITGLNPVIAIDQKTTNNNPRSTVGTTTEIYDYMRLLFARAGEAYSYVTGEKMVKYTEEQILSLIFDRYEGRKTYILAPVVRARKGHYRELFEQIRKKGFPTVRVDGEIRDITIDMRLDRYKNHDVEVVIDKLIIRRDDENRIKRTLRTAMEQGGGVVAILDYENNDIKFYSKRLMCPTTGISYNDPAPHDFSFNSPKGCCPCCHGTGYINRIDLDSLIPDRSVSIYDGGITAIGKFRNTLIFAQIQTLCENMRCSIKDPIKNLPDELIETIINGTEQRIIIKSPVSGVSSYPMAYNGIADYISSLQEGDATAAERKWAEQFSRMITCPECNGTRLKKESLCYRIGGRNIAELTSMDIDELYAWFGEVEKQLSDTQRKISGEIIKEIRTRLQFLIDVGLHYLSLGRASKTLSGGESQRIRLATQIGSQLVNVLYILDEPSIGLHPRDNIKLINSLKKLRDLGNTVVVVEHDRDMMLAADYIVDMGPKAGRLGGEVVFQGTTTEMLKSGTITASYLNGTRVMPIPPTRRNGNGKTISIKGACGNNLKNIDVDFPLGKFICITGVSGGGKSSLISNTLMPAIYRQFFPRYTKEPLSYTSIEGIEGINKLIAVDQSPIGRSPRSNPATYTGLFDDIRDLFAELPESKMRAYKKGRFSFNAKGGRCEECAGNGYRKLEMGFMPDVYVPCETCRGKRYNSETLEIRFKGKSIGDVLDMTINQAVEFFEHVPHLLTKLRTLQDVGVGYIKLGQSSTTLSGGENQRIKLSTELAKRDTGNTLYILDEPTTGLHFEDIRILLGVLDKLVDRGNSVIVIEHNTDVIEHADYIIDMGPEGGRGGGKVVATGTPEEIASRGEGETAPFISLK